MPDWKNIEALAGVTLTDGSSAIDYLSGEPAGWRTTEAKAILACIKQGWTLHKANIQTMARELNE
jgi:hypothetical protein